MKRSNTLFAGISIFCLAFGAQARPSEKMQMMAKTQRLIERHDIQNLDTFPEALMSEHAETFGLNFILKHGNDTKGPRGHLFELGEMGLGQSATPLQPRTILFDQKTGFSYSYNGGREVCRKVVDIDTYETYLGRFPRQLETEAVTEAEKLACTAEGGEIVAQKGGNSLDMMEFDHETARFELWKYDFTDGKVGQPNKDGCIKCHGPNNRPIFSMYPDWPGFYGSDNDELTSDLIELQRLNVIRAERNWPALLLGVDGFEQKSYQRDEREQFLAFRQYIQETNHPRYTPLFNSERVESLLGLEPLTHIAPGTASSRVWSNPDRDRPAGAVKAYSFADVFTLFPLRPDHTYISTRDVSRAFFFRPGLRFNVLMSRYHTKGLVKTIVEHENFADEKKLGKFFAFNLMRCVPKDENEDVLTKWFDKAKGALKTVKTLDGLPSSSKKRVVDTETMEGIRYAYPVTANGDHLSKKVRVLEYERNWMLFGLELKDVDMRYSYNKPEYNYTEVETTGPMKLGYFKDSRYFNSYNDGSTTTDELVAAAVVDHLFKSDSSFNQAVINNAEKYGDDLSWTTHEKVLIKDGESVREDVKQTTKSFVSPQGLTFWGLQDKYGKYSARYTLDQNFHKEMDSQGKWINLTFDKAVAWFHHRAPWTRSPEGFGLVSVQEQPYRGAELTQKGRLFTAIRDLVCESLEERLIAEAH